MQRNLDANFPGRLWRHKRFWITWMSLFRQLSRISFEIKNLIQVISCCHGNELMGECLARKHDQSGNFP